MHCQSLWISEAHDSDMMTAGCQSSRVMHGKTVEKIPTSFVSDINSEQVVLRLVYNVVPLEP